MLTCSIFYLYTPGLLCTVTTLTMTQRVREVMISPSSVLRGINQRNVKVQKDWTAAGYLQAEGKQVTQSEIARVGWDLCLQSKRPSRAIEP